MPYWLLWLLFPRSWASSGIKNVRPKPVKRIWYFDGQFRWNREARIDVLFSAMTAHLSNLLHPRFTRAWLMASVSTSRHISGTQPVGDRGKWLTDDKCNYTFARLKCELFIHTLLTTSIKHFSIMQFLYQDRNGYHCGVTFRKLRKWKKCITADKGNLCAPMQGRLCKCRS